MPAHWSKDFAEHLRTIHFTLVTVATGLILIAVSTKNYNSVVAAREMQQIIQLERLWTPEWIASKGISKMVLRSAPSSQPGTIADFGKIGTPMNKYLSFPQVLKSSPEIWMEYEIPLGAKGVLYGVHTCAYRGVHKIHVIEMSCNRRWADQAINGDWSPEKFPNTLIEFRRWWDALENRSYKILFPLRVRARATSTKGEKDPSTGKSRDKIFQWTLQQYRDSTPNEQVGLNMVVSNDGLHYLGPTKLGVIRVDVASFTYTEVTQKMLADHFETWKITKEPKRDSFASSFPDLAEATREFETLDLEKIEKILSDEAEKGGQVFEAFGMKFPAEQITVWGIVLLLAVQMYFCIYLKQLSGLPPTEEARDIPWPGMDNSWQAQFLYGVSVIVLPALALGKLTLRALSQTPHPFHDSFWTGFLFLLLPLALLGSLTLGIFSWKYRPQAQDSATPVISPTNEDITPSDEWPA